MKPRGAPVTVGMDSAWVRSHKPIRPGSASFSIVVAKAMPEGAPARYLGFIPHLTRSTAARIDEFLEHIGTA
jgi:hypothetical protein